MEQGRPGRAGCPAVQLPQRRGRLCEHRIGQGWMLEGGEGITRDEMGEE